MEKDNQQLIEDIKRRLAGYTLETPEENFDEAEVEAWVQLLAVLEGDEKADSRENEESLARFWEFWNKRMAEEGRCTEGNETLPEHGANRKKGGKTKTARRWYMTAAAAAVVFLVFVGGSFGSIAGKKQGFFYFLSRDKSGATIITSPESMETEKEGQISGQYYKPNEVPEEYMAYVADTAAVEGLRVYQLQGVDVFVSETGDFVTSFLVNQETQEKMQIGVTIYPNKMLCIRQAYDTYDYEYSVEQGGMEYELFSKPDTAGRTDYVVVFYVDNMRYSLSNKDDSGKLLEIAAQYYEYISD